MHLLYQLLKLAFSVTANGKTHKMSLPISDASSHQSKGGKANAAVDATEMSSKSRRIKCFESHFVKWFFTFSNHNLILLFSTVSGSKATKLFKPAGEFFNLSFCLDCLQSMLTHQHLPK